MVDIASLDTATRAAFSGCHNYVKNTAYLGNAYSSVLDTLDYYVIKSVAEPALSKAPEWVSDNRVITAIKNHQGISLAVGAAITVVSFVAFVIWLHPKGTTVKPKDTGTPPPSPEPKVKKDEDTKKATGTTPPPSTAKREKERVEGDKNIISYDSDLDEEETAGSAGDDDGTTRAEEKTRADGNESSEESNATASGVEEAEEKTYGPVSTSARKSLNALLTEAVLNESGVAFGALDLEHKEESGSSSPKDTAHPAAVPSLSTTTTVAEPSASKVDDAKTSDDSSALTGGDKKPAVMTDEESSSIPSTPTRPAAGNVEARRESQVLAINSNGYGNGSPSGSKSVEKSDKTIVAKETPKSSGKKKGKKKNGKKGKK